MAPAAPAPRQPAQRQREAEQRRHVGLSTPSLGSPAQPAISAGVHNIATPVARTSAHMGETASPTPRLMDVASHSRKISGAPISITRA
ncbi:hypothetical protein WJ970_23875 [Achromobacter xylosoxidans]